MQLVLHIKKKIASVHFATKLINVLFNHKDFFYLVRYEQAAKEYKTVLRGMLAIDGTEGKDLSESNESSPEHRMNQKMESGEGTKQRLAQKFTQPNPNTINFLTSEV